MATAQTNDAETQVLGIDTQTSRRWNIPNRQHVDMVGNEYSLETLFAAKHDVIVRTAASSKYNCHGLTFASRRTCIEDTAAVQKIMDHDGYENVPTHRVLPGDIVIYFDSDGSISHSGLVVEVPSGLPVFPKIVSKWGPNGAEYLHFVHRSEYGTVYRFYRIAVAAENSIISQILLTT